MKHEMTMFADDTKLWCKISHQADGISLEIWTDKWQMANLYVNTGLKPSTQCAKSAKNGHAIFLRA